MRAARASLPVAFLYRGIDPYAAPIPGRNSDRTPTSPGCDVQAPVDRFHLSLTHFRGYGIPNQCGMFQTVLGPLKTVCLKILRRTAFIFNGLHGDLMGRVRLRCGHSGIEVPKTQVLTTYVTVPPAIWRRNRHLTAE